MKKILAILLCLIPFAARAEVKTANLFTSNMVLQQKSTVKIWGTAKPGKDVTMTVSWDGSSYKAAADEAGRWEISFDTPSYGGPYAMTFREGRSRKLTVLDNVLIGEVWICTGQSNMEMRIADNVNGMEETLRDAANHRNVRLFHVKTDIGDRPAEDVSSVDDRGWETCSGDNLGQFSAAGYFFGLELEKQLGDVPVGLIESCLGGTLIQPWMSESSLRTIPGYAATLDDLKDLPESKELRLEKFNRDLRAWADKMSTEETKPGFDDSAWQRIPMPGIIQYCPGLKNFSGFGWIRRSVDIPAEWAGKELKLTLGSIDDYDFTYFNGVEIGHSEQLAYRSYTVPAALVKTGKAVIAVRIHDTGGYGGIWPHDNFTLAPEGEEGISLTGDWAFKPIQGLYDEPLFPTNTADNPNVPTFLFNRMILPLTKLPIAGAIWYQGESNSSEAEKYKTLLPVMIRDWRELWGKNFPFCVAQLANYGQEQTEDEESAWAELREAQLETVMHLENTGLAVLIDIGEANDIHPKNKPEAGRRLALNALALAYGKDIPCSGPIYKGFKIEGNSIRVAFDFCEEGLRTPDGSKEVKGFYIAGPDGKFHKADARIDGCTVVVSSTEVSLPLAVRYGWANNPVCNLYNSAMLPASPFRTK